MVTITVASLNSMAAVAYKKLKDYLGIKNKIMRYMEKYPDISALKLRFAFLHNL